MPKHPKVIKAFQAMKDIGISEDKVKPVLKTLLKLYDKNWLLIEEENYRALADAIFEREEAEARKAQDLKPKKPENIERARDLDEEATPEEPERPLKRLRLKYQEGQPSPSCHNASTALPTTLIKPKVEVDELPKDHYQSLSQGTMDLPHPSNGGRAGSSQSIQARNKGKKPVSPNSQPLQMREKHNKQLALQSASQGTSSALALIKPKDEPFTDDMPPFEPPIAVIHHESVAEGDTPNGNHLPRDQGGQEPLASTDIVPSEQLALIEDGPSSNLEIASSRFGEVKISINCAPAVGRPGFHLPSLEELFKSVEDKCLRSYKILDPNFSVTKLMENMCECVLELGTKPYNGVPETTNVMSAINQMEASLMEDDFDPTGRLPDSTNELLNFEADTMLAESQIPHLPPPCNGVHDSTLPDEIVTGNSNDGVANSAQNDLEQTNCQSMAGVELNRQILCELNDITNGQEMMMIPMVNEVNNESPTSFHYIPQNAVFQNAHVKFSLAHIGDNHCCSTCSGDCLLLSVPCGCAQQKGSGFAYTRDGLIKEELLRESISMNQYPKKHSQFFCKECPLESSKNDDTVEPCKGHLERTFIKECWWKCGCNKQCGNRVVQRGISRKLQVFMTSDGKGWGLRTLEDLPKGAFICEYAGEVLTNAEFFGRVSRSPSGAKHSYPVLLDAGWGSGGMLKDEEALCLDGTYYGNIARFINHRCFDSNLVEIPVEIESPDHHYYRLAFFTTRDVAAMEELTWDYGIDFDDLDHPIKAFQCECGSKFCRNIKRLSRSRGRR